MRSAVLHEIQLLHHLANNALLDHSITEVLQGVADSIASQLPADRVSIIGFNTQRRSVDYFVEAGKGRKNVLTAVTYDELNEGLSGWVLSKGIPAISPKGKPDPRESAAVQARRIDTNCGSILVLPVRNHRTLLATVTVINLPEERDFDRRDVEILTVFSGSIAVLIENAKLLADLQLSRDVAEVSRLRLAEENAMKDKLFTILAHDLRGPVGNLSSLLNLVSETPLSIEEYREVIHEGQRSAAQTYGLLDNLLGWVRSQLQEVAVLSTRFLVVNSLVSVQQWLGPQARSKGIELRVECPEGLTAAADQRMFETILRNFVSNAVKYSAGETLVSLRAVQGPDSVVLEVADRGQGISAEKLGRLFGRHSVESETGTNGERGSGLGLMFCADLARALGGHLEAESNLGRGSTFRLVLPDPLDGEL